MTGQEGTADGAGGDARAGDAGPGGADGVVPNDAAPTDAVRTPDAAPTDAIPTDTAAADQSVHDVAVDPDDGVPSPDAGVPPPDAAPPDDPCLASVVRVGNVEVFAYEASRLDADADGPGVDDTRACSVAGVWPWSGMTLADATEACQASGFDVCSGDTWFELCAGDDPDDERDFPYGDAYVAARCNDHVSGGGALEVTGVRELCRTRDGLYDMSGNLWELVAEGERRGASWKVSAATFRLDAAKCHSHFVVPPNFWAVDLGFRCCRAVD